MAENIYDVINITILEFVHIFRQRGVCIVSIYVDLDDCVSLRGKCK
ncbi:MULTISPECIES: hypothetical protein [unclassified Maridesulfovibrio]